MCELAVITLDQSDEEVSMIGRPVSKRLHKCYFRHGRDAVRHLRSDLRSLGQAGSFREGKRTLKLRLVVRRDPVAPDQVV
jgi:hypothetical protein